MFNRDPSDSDLHDLFEPARRVLLTHREASTSLLQRHFRLAHVRAQTLLERLHEAGVVSAASPGGSRLLAPQHYTPVQYPAPVARERHLRLLRDLALYAVECREHGEGLNSDAVRIILEPRQVPLESLRDAAASVLDGAPAAPVTRVALALSRLPDLQPATGDGQFEHDLRVACAAVERCSGLELNGYHDRTERGFVQLVRYLDKRLGDGWGAHSRAFEYFLPDTLIPQGTSLAAKQLPSGALHREHVVPCVLLRERCNELLRAGVPTLQIARWLRGWLVIVRITKPQADILDHQCGLKTRMPANKTFEDCCVFERLHEGGIEFEPPPGYRVCSHVPAAVG